MTQEFVSQEAPKYDVDKHHNQQVIMLQMLLLHLLKL